MESFKPKVRVCKNKVLQILTPNDPAQLRLFGRTKYSVKNLQYDKVWRSKGYIKIQQNGKLGLVDQNGTEVLPIKFDNIQIYERGFLCTEGTLSFFYNLDGTKRVFSDACVEMYFPKHKMLLLCRLEMINPFVLEHEDGGLVNHNSFDSYMDLPDKLLLRKGYNPKRLMIDKKTGVISWVVCRVCGVGDKDSDAIICYQNGKEGLILRRGSEYKEIIKPGVYEKIEVVKLNSLYPNLPIRIKVSRNGKEGVVDWEGKVLIPCVYDKVWEYNDLGIVVEKNGKEGLYTDKKVLSCCYDKILEPIRRKNIIVCKNGLYGVASKTGVDEIIVPIKYLSVNDVSLVGYNVEEANRYGFYDLSGKQILMPLYDSITPIMRFGMTEVFLKVGMKSEESTRVGITDFKGKIIVPIAYKDIDICGSEIIVQGEFGCGLFSCDGKKLLPDDYDSIEQITTNFYRVCHDGKYGAYFTLRRKMVIPIKYSWVDIDKAGNLFGQVPFMQIPM